MDEKQLTAFIAILAPRVLALLAEDKGVSEQEAIRVFYNSELYAMLEQEETKLWRLSAEALYALLKEELETGVITYPEEL
jgi:hypothetical protein